MPSLTHKSVSVSTFGLICLIWLAYSLFSYLAPVALDDEYFRYLYSGYNNGNSDFSFQAMGELIANLWQNENGRFSNHIAPIFSTILPHWVSAMLLGSAITLMVIMAAKLSCANGKTGWRTLSLVWMATAFLFPWHENIILIAYTLNYPFSAAVELSFLYIMLTTRHNRRQSVLSAIGSGALALFAGGTHEAFYIPMFFALTAISLRHRLKLSSRWWIYFALFMVGMSAAILSPASWQRAAASESVDLLRKIIGGKHVIAFGMSAIALLVLTIIIGIMQKKRRNEIKAMFAHDKFIALATMVITGSAIAMATSYARGAWMAEMSAVIMLVHLIRRATINATLRFKSIACAVAVTITSAFYIGNIAWQWIFYRQDKEVNKLLVQSADGCAYYDCINYPAFYTLQQPFHLHWISNFSFGVKSMNDSLKREIKVLPTDFIAFDASNADIIPVPGSAEACYFKNHLLVRHWEEDTWHMGTLYVVQDNGKKHGMYCSFVKVPGNSGLYLANPHNRRHLGRYTQVNATM